MLKALYLWGVQRLIPLNLPIAQLKLVKKEGIPYVWDSLRGKYLKLTPEEWVRQHFINYMINDLNYPKSGIALEGGLKVNNQSFRTDILLYKDAVPWMIVECKAPDIKLTQQVLDQASLYNLTYQTPYIAITNGIKHFSYQVHKETKQYTPLTNFPSYVS